MSSGDNSVNPLVILQWVQVLLPIATAALNEGRQVTREELEAASAQLGVHIDALDALIAAKGG